MAKLKMVCRYRYGAYVTLRGFEGRWSKRLAAGLGKTRAAVGTVELQHLGTNSYLYFSPREEWNAQIVVRLL